MAKRGTDSLPLFATIYTQKDRQQHEDDNQITVTNAQHDQSPSSSTPLPPDSTDHRTDHHSDARFRHDQILLLCVEQHVWKEASKSCREKLDVHFLSFSSDFYSQA